MAQQAQGPQDLGLQVLGAQQLVDAEALQGLLAGDLALLGEGLERRLGFLVAEGVRVAIDQLADQVLAQVGPQQAKPGQFHHGYRVIRCSWGRACHRARGLGDRRKVSHRGKEKKGREQGDRIGWPFGGNQPQLGLGNQERSSTSGRSNWHFSRASRDLAEPASRRPQDPPGCSPWAVNGSPVPQNPPGGWRPPKGGRLGPPRGGGKGGSPWRSSPYWRRRDSMRAWKRSLCLPVRFPFASVAFVQALQAGGLDARSAGSCASGPWPPPSSATPGA
jgi:hypothetical protein